MNYKPMLYPNTVVAPEDMTYPLIVSTKFDGVRVCIKEGQVFSRALKPVPNKYFRYYFREVIQHTKVHPNIVIDAEFYHDNKTHGEIVSAFRTEDYPDLEGFRLILFDIVDLDNLEEIYSVRQLELMRIAYKYPHCELIPSYRANFPGDVELLYNKAIEEGYEGLVLNKPSAYYKFGRITAKSGDGYKMKPLETYDSKIIGIEQATIVDPKALKKTNELGMSETSKKKGDRVPIPMARSFIVEWEGKELLVPIAESDEQKEYIWNHQDEYIGRWVEWAGMPYGMKDSPRFPRTVRMREDK